MVTVAPSHFGNIFKWPVFEARRHDNGSVALPSIRQAIPELHLANPSHRYSVGSQTCRTDYTSSPRRRISNDEKHESLQSNYVSKLYRKRSAHCHPSPHSHLPSLPSPADLSASVSLGSAAASPIKCYSVDHNADDNRHNEHVHMAPRHSRSYDYGYAHPLAYGAMSPSGRPYDCPRRVSAYGSLYQEGIRCGDIGGMVMGFDSKIRKRRGNLPRETSDKLRAWFVAHLQHPYPTEDEKQDLMRQTNLQISQISNWFINARRRQLPAMISNTRSALNSAHGLTDY